MTIKEFALLKTEQQLQAIYNKAMLIDHYEDNQCQVLVYFLDEFFIEISRKGDQIMDIIPCRKGHRLTVAKTQSAAIAA